MVYSIGQTCFRNDLIEWKQQFVVVEANCCCHNFHLKHLPPGCLKLLEFQGKIIIIGIKCSSGHVCRMTVCPYSHDTAQSGCVF